ncbi:MAG: hypothetical protein ACFFDN_50460, partial [Candidatus Hodarchaeota archaeon]
MADLKLEVTYFEKKGPDNTDKALEIAKKYANQLGIEDIIIASTAGMTAEKALDYFNPNETNVVIITHACYFTGSQLRQEFPEDKMESL